MGGQTSGELFAHNLDNWREPIFIGSLFFFFFFFFFFFGDRPEVPANVYSKIYIIRIIYSKSKLTQD